MSCTQIISLNHIPFSKNINIKSNYTASKTGIVNGVTPISESGQGETDIISIAKTFVTFNPSIGLMNGRSKLELNYYYIPTQMSLTESFSFKFGMLGMHYYYTLLR